MASVDPSCQFLSITPNYDGYDADAKGAEVMELLINTQLLRDNARSFDHFRDTFAPNIVNLMHQLISIMVHIGSEPYATARSFYTFEQVPHQTQIGIFSAIRFRLYYQDRLDATLKKRVFDLLNRNENGANPTAASAAVSSSSSSDVSINSDGMVFPAVTNPYDNTSSSSSSSLSSSAPAVGSSSSDNPNAAATAAAAPRRKRYQPGKQEKQLLYQRVGRREWAEIVSGLTVRIATPNDLEVVMQSDSDFSPIRAFSLPASFIASYNLEAAHRFCQSSNYHEYGINGELQRYKWPDPKYVWKVNGPELTPANYRQRFFPWVPKPKASMNLEREMILRQSASVDLPDHLIGNDARMLEFMAQSRRRKKLSEHEREAVYDNQTNRKASTSTILDLEKLASINAERFDDLEKQCTSVETGVVDTCLLAAWHRQVRVEMLKAFHQHLWTVDGHIPYGMRQVVTGFNEHLKKNLNFCMPMRKITSNLSRLGDSLCSLTAQLEVAFGINVVHNEIVATILSCFEVYSGAEMHRNVLLTGPARASKSHTFKVLKKLLVEGTVQFYAYSTPKAKTASSDMFDQIIEVFEDVVPNALGVKEKGGKASSSSNTEQESIMKQQLTSGETRAQGVAFDSQGQRVSQSTVVPCNNVTLMASNVMQCWVPEPMLTRFSTYQYQLRERLDTNGLVGQMGRSTDHQAAALFRKRIQRNQVLSAYIWWLIRACILPQINMLVVCPLRDQIFERLSFQSDNPNLNDPTKCVRNATRVDALIKALVIWDAIDKVFDLPAEENVLLSKVFEPKDILLVAKHLVAKTEHLVIALGLEEHTYEDRIFHNVAHYIQDRILQVTPAANEERYTSDTRIRVMAEMKEVRAVYETATTEDEQAECEVRLSTLHEEYEKADSAYCSGNAEPLVPHSESKKSSYDPSTNQWRTNLGTSEKLTSQSHFIAALSNRIWEGIYPKPQLDDIKAAVEKMMSMKIPGPDGKSEVMALSYDSYGEYSASRTTSHVTNVFVARDILRHLDRQSKTLFNCIQETLQYEGAPARTYLYGAMNPDVPYVWRVMEVHDKGKAALMVRDVNYVEKTQLEIMNRGLEGVNAASRGRLPVPNAAASNSSSTVFSSESSFMFIDGNIDEWATTKMNESLFLTPEAANKHPSNSDLVFNQVMKYDKIDHAAAAAGNVELSERLFKYPECYEAAMKGMKAYTDKQKSDAERNKDRHRMTSLMRRIKEAQAVQLDDAKIDENEQMLIRVNEEDDDDADGDEDDDEEEKYESEEEQEEADEPSQRVNRRKRRVLVAEDDLPALEPSDRKRAHVELLLPGDEQEWERVVRNQPYRMDLVEH